MASFKMERLAVTGEVLSERVIEYDLSTHEAYRETLPERRISCVIDSPDVKLTELQEAVEGYIELVHVDPFHFVVVNEDGLRLEMMPNLHERVLQASIERQQTLVGPMVLFTRLDDPTLHGVACDVQTGGECLHTLGCPPQ